MADLLFLRATDRISHGMLAALCTRRLRLVGSLAFLFASLTLLTNETMTLERVDFSEDLKVGSALSKPDDLPLCKMEPALCNREGLTKLQKQQLAAASRMRRTILAMGLAGGATLAKCAIACFLIGLLLQFLIAGRQLQQVSPPPSFCASKSPQGLASTSHLLSWKLDRFCRWWWFPFELTCPMVSMKLFVLALLFIHFHVLMVPRPGVLAAPELVGIMKRHPPSPYPMLPFTEWLLPGLSPETAKSWMESLCQLRSRMILCWFGFLLLPNWSHRAHINKGLQVAHGLLYGYGALIYAFFAAIHYAYTKKHSDYGGIVSVLAAIFAVPFLETNPMAGSWLRKFLIINAVIPIYLFAGICKVRYLGPGFWSSAVLRVPGMFAKPRTKRTTKQAGSILCQPCQVALLGVSGCTMMYRVKGLNRLPTFDSLE